MLDLISIHIPKTAGRSLLAIFNSVYNSETFAHFDRKYFSDKSISEAIQFKSLLNENIRVIHGHFHYNEIQDLKNSNTKIITWMREPVDRVISNFSFFKKRILLAPNDVELQNRKNESLIEYASKEDTRNLMSRFTKGSGLKDFYFIGITEYFDEDVRILAECLNWKHFDIPRVNDNSEFKSNLPVATDADKKLIAELNREDIALYEQAIDIRRKRKY